MYVVSSLLKSFFFFLRECEYQRVEQVLSGIAHSKFQEHRSSSEETLLFFY